MKYALSAVLLKFFARIFGDKVAGAFKAFFGFLESLGINPGIFLIIVTIGLVVYIVLDFIQLRRNPRRGNSRGGRN